MRKAFLILLSTVLAAMLLVSCASTGADNGPVKLTDHAYTDIGTLPNFDVVVNGKAETVTAVEGCVMVDGYAYVAKVKDTMAGYIYRMDVKTGEKITLKNADTGLENCTDISHANDMAHVEIDGKDYILVGTLSEVTSNAILMLELIDKGDGNGVTEYRIVRRYSTLFKIMYQINVYGLEVLSVDGHKISILVKSGLDFYTGTIDLDSDLNKILLNKSFSIKGGDVIIDGQTFTVTLNDYYQQGYTILDGKIYVPFTRMKTDYPHTILFVYDLNDTSEVRSPILKETLMFRDPESSKFEMEALSYYDGKMYFSTNLNMPVIDGFHYFEF